MGQIQYFEEDGNIMICIVIFVLVLWVNMTQNFELSALYRCSLLAFNKVEEGKSHKNINCGRKYNPKN